MSLEPKHHLLMPNAASVVPPFSHKTPYISASFLRWRSGRRWPRSAGQGLLPWFHIPKGSLALFRYLSVLPPVPFVLVPVSGTFVPFVLVPFSETFIHFVLVPFSGPFMHFVRVPFSGTLYILYWFLFRKIHTFCTGSLSRNI